MMGETEGWMGDRFVGEVTLSEDRLRESDVEDRLSTIADSPAEACEDDCACCCCC